MEMNKKLHIVMCPEDVKASIARDMYNIQGISGLYEITFKTKREFYKGINLQDSDYRWVFDGAEIIVDLNDSI